MLEFFLNPWLLGGLGFASMPVIIHLLNRRRYIVHDWAAMDFLLQAQVMNRRRLKLEDLLLLLLRIALICLLVFAVARPVVKGLAGWREDQRVVVLDQSGSMGYLGTTGPVLERAKEAAESQVLDALGGSIPVSLRFGASPRRDSVDATEAPRGGSASDSADGDANAQASDLLGRLHAETTVDAPARFAQSLERVLDEASADPSPLLRNIVLVSDFSLADWTDGAGSLHRDLAYVFEEIQRREAGARFRFQLIRTASGDAENVSVSGFRVDSRHALAGVPVRFEVEVTNHGRAPRAGIAGTIEIGRPDAEAFAPVRSLPLPAFDELASGASASVEVVHIFDVAGEYPVRVALEGDRLTADDASYLILPVREGLRAAIVDSDRSGDRFARESGYLLAALAPRGDGPTGVVPLEPVATVDAAALEDVDVALVLNRASVSEAERDVLERFVVGGGGVAWFLGGRASSASYETLATRATRVPIGLERAGVGGGRGRGAEGRDPVEPGSAATGDTPRATPPADGAGLYEDGPPLFPAAIGDDASASGRRLMQVVEREHPVFAVFDGLEGISIEKVAFDRFLPLRPSPRARVLATYDDDARTPAFVETTIGPGRVVVLNTSADRDWSDWPTHMSYPIVLQELVRYLAPSRSSERLLAVGESIVWPARPGMRYEVVDPAGEAHAIESAGAEVASILSYSSTERAGFYRVVGRPVLGGEPESRWYACRWASEESRLETLGESELDALLANSGVDYQVGSATDVDAFRREQEGEIWRFLALAAGVLLLLELVAAWWFGRR